jgi:putative beta-lysine N-acetyltransferase
MTADVIIIDGGTILQHGSLNNRVYLMKLEPGSAQSSLEKAEALAGEHCYAKIVAKVPASAMEYFAEKGYVVEAVVPGFFKGREDGYFVARYLDPERREVPDIRIIENVLGTALSLSRERRSSPPPGEFEIRPAGAGDAPALADLYKRIFETYPFPIHDPGYIEETMKTHIRYYCAVREGRMVAASSAETDRGTGSVEMTDFATHQTCRGIGLCSMLLERMEGNIQLEGIHTAYTIARAAVYPINITFAHAGYQYGGTLFRNTNICGSFESMNVWYKTFQ